MKKYDAVRVTWTDAALSSMWLTVADAEQDTPIVCSSIGHWLGADKKYVRICQTIAGNGKASGTLIIPKGWVKSVKRVKIKVVKHA